MTGRIDGTSLVLAAFGAASALAIGVTAGSEHHRLLKLLCLVLALVIALSVSAPAFLAVVVVAFAVSTSFPTPVVPSLPVPIYFADFTVLLVALRGAWPRDRVAARRRLRGAPAMLFTLWWVLMAVAAGRAWAFHNVPLSSALRGDLAAIYWPLLYFGFSRTLRERSLQVSALWRHLSFVAVGFIGWMLLARAINHPFHDTGVANVPVGDNNQTVQRNFGFEGAFLVYPVVAVIGLAGMAHDATRRLRWPVLAAIGTGATLLTLVRGEIYGLAIAAIVVLRLRAQRPGSSSRARAARQLALSVAAVVLALFVVTPKLGHAIVQRSLPFVHQAREATANADYRAKAVTTGIHSANAHVFGQGVLDVQRLQAENIDIGFLAHSGVATLLLFGGWPLLVVAGAAIVAVIRRSAAVPAPRPWIHPALVGTLTLLSVYAVGAASLAGDPWVIPLGVLAIAIRFRLADHEPPAETEDAPSPLPAARPVRAAGAIASRA